VRPAASQPPAADDPESTAVERVTVLFPCKDQREGFLRDAVESILQQSSPHWELLVGLDESPEWIHALFDEIDDERVRVIPEAGPGFAQSLNRMIEAAQTPFVSILLSDDRYAPDAIETLLSYRMQYPEADFFHSSRRYMDASGTLDRAPFQSKESFELDDFKRSGSPVKHLLCWRRELALRVGGMDESLSLHGCDDFDFPWSMAEAGARFQAVAECLYEYRIHNEGPRLTTGTPLQTQVKILERMFEKHGATREETCAFLDRAADSYLPVAFAGHPSDERDSTLHLRRWRQADESARSRFERRATQRPGVDEGQFIPHEVHLLPRGGRDALELAERLCEISDPAALRQVLLFAAPPNEDEAAGEGSSTGARADDAAPVAEANLVLSGAELYVTTLTDEWTPLLLNGVLECALDSGVETVCLPKEGYGGAIQTLFEAGLEGEWWRIPTRANEDRVAGLDRRLRLDQRGRTICVAHDIERGQGHRDVEPAFAAEADRRAPAALRRMLAVERASGVRATYCIVGSLLDEIRPLVEGDGHALGFHSFEHRLPNDGPDAEFEELVRCRVVDDSIRGYRPPQSKIGPGLADAHLARHNIEWFASSRSSLGTDWPGLENGIVKIPIHIDDFDLHRDRLGYEEWEEKVVSTARDREFFAIGLHDCYADHWIDHYPGLLEKLGALGTFRTFDEVADDVVSGASRWSFGAG